jgi:hypothetical protein
MRLTTDHELMLEDRDLPLLLAAWAERQQKKDTKRTKDGVARPRRAGKRQRGNA